MTNTETAQATEDAARAAEDAAREERDRCRTAATQRAWEEACDRTNEARRARWAAEDDARN